MSKYQGGLLPERDQFLLCRTPDLWLQTAVRKRDVLLIDHANCEKKAAATAINLMFRYTEHTELQNKMSRLAREELRHFEQVLAILNKRNIIYQPLPASRYASRLRQQVRTHEPARMIDTLVVGAFIEARSCERFESLAPLLDGQDGQDKELGQFYRSLLKSEARHFQDYLTLAREAAGYDLADRIAVFAEADRRAIEEHDEAFHFHSGLPT